MTLGENSEGRDLKVRYLYLAILMMLGLLVLGIRLYRLQIAQGDEYAAKSVDNFVKKIRVPADRGMIKDRRGEILVDNRPSFDLFVTPAFCQKCREEVLPKLAGWLSWDEEQLERAREQVRLAKHTAPFQPSLLRVDLTRDEVDPLNAQKLELPGVDILRVPHRNYRKGPMMAHLLGYMNEVTQEELDRLNAERIEYALGDYIGRRGVERFYEQRLRGVDGLRKEVVNARGEPIPGLSELLGGEEAVATKPGQNVVLSIDWRLQEAAEQAFPGVAGALVAMDVKSGFLLAIVSRPSFDPNLLSGRVSPAQLSALVKDPLQPMVYRPTAQHYSPGSTFKPFTMFAALRSGAFGPHSSVNCTGGYRLGSRVWRCMHQHGLIHTREALKASCDTYFYKVGDTLGLDPIAEMGKAFGFGSPTGIDVVAEVPGIMPSSEYHNARTPGGYTKGLALNSAIGQGDDNMTPLQLTLAYATVANGGTLYQPQVVRRIESLEGTVQEFQPKVVRNLDLAAEHRHLVIDALTAAVNEPGGTAYRIRNKEITIAGKTGTAQVARIGTVRVKKEHLDYWQRDHAWFASFAPVEDPEIAVVVLNEHGGLGGSEAAPTAAAVIQKYFDLKKIDAAGEVVHLPKNLQIEPIPDLPHPESPRAPARRPDPSRPAVAAEVHSRLPDEARPEPQ